MTSARFSRMFSAAGASALSVSKRSLATTSSSAACRQSQPSRVSRRRACRIAWQRRVIHFLCYVGMRNWHPLLPDTLRDLRAAGLRRAVGFIAAAQHSYSSCQQYRENVAAARAELRRDGDDVEVTFVGSWFDHPLFIAANAAHVREALEKLPEHLRASARLVCTAHSIPSPMAAASRYEAQLRESARLVAEEAGIREWAVVYQSRSGRPGDPWLEPDIMRLPAHANGPRASKRRWICPIGFVCDHIEVLYDLDREAAAVSREIGLAMARAEAVNDDPLFLDMMADVVLRTITKYEHGRPLPLAAAFFAALVSGLW